MLEFSRVRFGVFGPGFAPRLGARCGLYVAVRPYADSTLAAARHTYDLKRAAGTTVHLDAGLHGVGDDDSWGAHPEYPVPGEEPRRLRLWLRPAPAPLP